MAPVLLIALGGIFMVGQFVPAWGIRKTWPLLLIVIGVTRLIDVLFWKNSEPSCQRGKPL